VVLPYKFTWPEELNVIRYACAKFQFPFCEFYRESYTYQKILCKDEMIILKLMLREYVGRCGLD
jgi:hypothetical protein